MSDYQAEYAEVYFIECGNFIKIGITTNLQDRIASFETATPYDIRVLAVIPSATRQTELELHRRFADAHHKGEWFRKTPGLLKFIKEQSWLSRSTATILSFPSSLICDKPAKQPKVDKPTKAKKTAPKPAKVYQRKPALTLVCHGCGQSFETSQPNRKWCAPKCRRDYRAENQNRKAA
jgi:hypothetical protein